MTSTATSRTARMRQQRRTVSEDKHRAVRTAVERCVAQGRVMSAAAVARASEVTETFLYRHEAEPCSLCLTAFGGGPVTFYRSRMAAIAGARETAADSEGRLSAASAQAELANARASNQRLRRQVQALERRMGEVAGAQAQDGLSELARLSQEADPISARRTQDLSAQVRDLDGRLADRDEELAAVRRLNADLTRQLNVTAG
jgi:hypothetical protein